MWTGNDRIEGSLSTAGNLTVKTDQFKRNELKGTSFELFRQGTQPEEKDKSCLTIVTS